jgi:hypothetical protein
LTKWREAESDTKMLESEVGAVNHGGMLEVGSFVDKVHGGRPEAVLAVARDHAKRKVNEGIMR